MNFGSIFWLSVFFISALLFFIIAVVVTIFGAKDLKYLLTRSIKR